jgi:hypothetical protein
MANTILWTSTGTYTTVITSGQLSGLTTGAGTVSTDNITSRDQYAEFELQCTSTGAFASGDHIDVYFLIAADGTNFEDGSSSITPARAPDLIIPVRAVTNTSQRVTMKHVLLPNGLWRTLLINQATRALSTGTNILSYLPYNDQIQTV